MIIVPTRHPADKRIFLAGGLDLLFLLCSIQGMTDRPASWRMPTPKQIQKLAAATSVGGNVPAAPSPGPADPMPPEYWESVLNDPRADAGAAGKPIQAHNLTEIARHVLRVSCSRCGRIVEIQKADAIRLYGQQAVWKHVGQRLLDNTCTQRTGRLEEDGCWPSFEI